LKMAAASMPQMPSMPGPSLIDIGAIQKLYADSKRNVNDQATSGRANLEQLASVGTKDAERVAAATDRRLAELETMRALDAKNSASRAAESGAGAVADLKGQGIDGAALAGLQAQMTANQADAAHSGDAMAALLADQRSQAELAGVRRQSDMAQGNIEANRYLDQNLFAAMAGLNQNELSAVQQANQQNAQAQQQYAQQQYQLAADQANQRAQLPAALMQQLSQFPTAYATPGRNAVLERLMQGANPQAEAAMRVALMGSTNADDAIKAFLNTGVKQINTDRKVKSKATGGAYKQYVPNLDVYQALANQFYRQDPSQIDPQVAKMILGSYGLG